MFFYESLLKPLLFCLDPEEAHHLVCRLLPACQGVMESAGRLYRLAGLETRRVTLAGTQLEHPIGLAAGFDKNGLYIQSLAALGFAYVEIGSVTARGGAGNPRPRLFRLPRDRALINRLGLNNDGADRVALRLRNVEFPLPVALNIAKSNLPGLSMQDAADDIAYTYERMAPLPFFYVTINTSCPNTHDGALFGARELELILKAVRLSKHQRPLYLKLSPDSPDEFLEEACRLAALYEVHGLVTGNTTASRPLLLTGADLVSDIGQGGLSGAPLLPLTRALMSKVATFKAPYQEIIACGGITSGDEVAAMLEAGADAVQIYSALVYRGPLAVLDMLGELASSGLR